MGRALRVLLVTESSAKGTGRHVMDLAEGLMGRGCEVHLLYSPVRLDSAFRGRLGELTRLRATPLPMRTAIHPGDLSAVLAVRRYLKKAGPFDILHGHSSKGGAVARLAGFGTGVAVFYTPHGLVTMDPDLAASKRAIYRAIEVMLARFASRIIAVSPEERRACIALGMGAGRLAMIPNGVGLPSSIPRDEARKRLGVEADDCVAGFVGRLIEYKAPELLIDALASIHARYPRLKVVMIGDGPMKQELVERARQKGVAEKLLLVGEMNAHSVYSAFDLFVSPSRKEGLPYVILEAMAAGLPIVATRASGVELLVVPASNGLIVPTDDVASFAQALATLAGSPELRGRMSDASRAQVIELSQEKMVDRTLAEYWNRVKAAEKTAPGGLLDEELIDDAAVIR